MTFAAVADALVLRIASMSALKVCLVLARQTDCGRHRVRLTVTDFAELTGMAKQTILDGLAVALNEGWIERESSGNSFWYVFSTQNMDQSETETRPKRYGIQAGTVRDSDLQRYGNQTETVRDLDQAPSENQTVSLRNSDRFGKPKHIPDFKDRTLERSGATEIEEEEAYRGVVRAAGHHIAEWLRDVKQFDFVRAHKLWGDQLEALWKRAVEYESRKPRDQARFRFQDACEGILDLGVKPQQEQPEIIAGAARGARLGPGDQARTPDGRVHEVLDVCANGMVVFDDDSPPMHLRSLEPVMAAVA